MCGISGIISKEVFKIKPAIEKMTEAQVHRGSDNIGYFFSDNIGLGHNRLSIIDTSELSNQPMTKNNLTLCFNGEIYNYNDLKEYHPNNYNSNGDAEVILNLWKEYGISAIKCFNGMFAFALYNHDTKKMYLVRDYIGIKPLYFYKDNQSLVFASELRAIIKSGMANVSLNQNALHGYLKFQSVYAPDTLIQNTQLLEPGHYLEIDTQTLKITKHKYWEVKLQYANESFGEGYKDYCQGVKENFYRSVKKRMIADVPMGAFLSGGIDSTAIVAAMSKQSDKPIETFNISFDEKEYNESHYAKIVASKYKTNHHEIRLTPDNLLKMLPDAVSAIDNPTADGINTWVISKVVAEAGIKSVLSGIGGDELFAGYAIFKRITKLKKYQALYKLPLSLRTRFANWYCKTPRISHQKIKYLLSLPHWDLVKILDNNRTVHMPGKINDILAFHSDFKHDPSLLKKIPINSRQVLNQTSIYELNTYLPNVLLRDADQMGMAHTLEIRTPFLDHFFINYVMTFSDQVKYPITPKKFFTDSMGDDIPDDIINRPKMGFSFPWAQWISKELNSFVQNCFYDLAKRDYFNKKELIIYKDMMMHYPESYHNRLWSIAVLEHWLQTNNIS